MKFFSLYRVELRRLALSKFTWIIAALSLCGPLFGYSLFMLSDPSTTTGMYIANPVLAGTVIGSILWAILSVLECDRVYRAKTDALIDSVSSSISMAVSRILALITLSTATSFLCALVYLPYTIVKVDYLFDASLYSLSFIILMTPTWWISILLVSAIYQITRRMEITGLLYAGFVYLSFSGYFISDYFMRWINPVILQYSDGFTNAPILRIALYTRVLWLLISGGIFALSLTCIRRYQKNLVQSLFKGMRKAYIPITALILIYCGSYLWIAQPFVDHGPYEYDHTYQYRDSDRYSTGTLVSDIRYSFGFDTALGTLKSKAEYRMDKYFDNETKECFWLNPGYKVTRISLEGQELEYETLRNEVNGERQTFFTLPQCRNNIVTVEYEGYPSSARYSPTYMTALIGNGFIQLLNSDSVPSVPSFNLPRNCTVELNLPGKFVPIIDHKMLTNYQENPDGSKTWQGEVNLSQMLWIAACDYRTVTFEAAGAEIDFVYSAKYDEIIHQYNVQGAIADVMNYCSEHQGKLQFADDNRLMMLQKDSSGGYAGDGWVEWGEVTFTDNNLSDPLKGASAEEVFAHEIIHQWWGGLGVHSGDEWDSSIELWSNEGLTVYTTYRLMKEKYGELYAKQNYVDQWQEAVDAQNRDFYNRHPEYLDKLPKKYQAQVKFSSHGTNLYSRMPLMILKAEKLVGGEEKFDEILQSIQAKYSLNGLETPFTYQQFLDACGLREEDLILE